MATKVKSVVLKALQPPEAERFALLEKVCSEGQQVFYLVGMALGEIRDRKFYEAKGFKTFTEYADSIGYSRRHCNQLIIDAKTVAELPEAFRELLTTERAARELAKLPAALRAPVAEAASNGGKKAITKEAVKKNSPIPPRPATSKKTTTTPPPPRQAKRIEPEKLKDATGLELPAEVLPLWERAQEAAELVMYCSAVRNKLRKYQEAGDLLFAEIDFSDDMAKLSAVLEDLERAKPYAVCPSCQGKIAKGCKLCKERGVVSKFTWDHIVTKEARDMREKIVNECKAS